MTIKHVFKPEKFSYHYSDINGIKSWFHLQAVFLIENINTNSFDYRFRNFAIRSIPIIWVKHMLICWSIFVYQSKNASQFDNVCDVFLKIIWF